MSDDRVWQVRLPDGSIWIPPDSQPNNPRASWIYAKSTADMFARDLGGTVVEVTRRQKEKLLDKEIASALNEKPKVDKLPKLRTRPFARADRREIATAILAYVPLHHNTRSALDTARETSDDAAYKTALKTLKTGLPDILWICHDGRHVMVQEAQPLWITEDPQGEDPKHCMQIDRNEIAKILVEDG